MKENRIRSIPNAGKYLTTEITAKPPPLNDLPITAIIPIKLNILKKYKEAIKKAIIDIILIIFGFFSVDKSLLFVERLPSDRKLL